jgi:tetratricopeptide (TPR) repeat protein
MKHISIVIAIILFVIPCLARAQADSVYIVTPEDSAYLELVVEALAKPDSVDYTPIRLAYTKTSFCTSTIGDADLISSMRQAYNEKRYDDAILYGEKIVKGHFVNARAHMTLDMAYEELGEQEKAAFYYLIAYGLIQSILASGDGKTPETAYQVIAVSEEYVITDVLGYKVAQQVLLDIEGSSYDELKVIDRETDEEMTLYFNVDILMELYGKEFE